MDVTILHHIIEYLKQAQMQPFLLPIYHVDWLLWPNQWNIIVFLRAYCLFRKISHRKEFRFITERR